MVDLIGEYRNWDEVLRDYPDLEPDDLRQAFQFAFAHMDGTIDMYLDAA